MLRNILGWVWLVLVVGSGCLAGLSTVGDEERIVGGEDGGAAGVLADLGGEGGGAHGGEGVGDGAPMEGRPVAPTAERPMMEEGQVGDIGGGDARPVRLHQVSIFEAFKLGGQPRMEAGESSRPIGDADLLEEEDEDFDLDAEQEGEFDDGEDNEERVEQEGADAEGEAKERVGHVHCPAKRRRIEGGVWIVG